MADMHGLFNIKRCLEEALDETKAQICREQKSVRPLTYAELDALSSTDQYEDLGVHIWVQIVGYNYIVAAVLDWYNGECIAITGYGDENAFWGRTYGTEWVAYETKPVMNDEQMVTCSGLLMRDCGGNAF